VTGSLLGNDRAGLRRPEALVVSRVSASASVSIVVNAARAIDIYFVVHINCILYIGGLKPIGGRSHLRVSTSTTAAGGPRAPRGGKAHGSW
jgi:hypothetical protein